jgi:hypothetical protein
LATGEERSDQERSRLSKGFARRLMRIYHVCWCTSDSLQRTPSSLRSARPMQPGRAQLLEHTNAVKAG